MPIDHLIFRPFDPNDDISRLVSLRLAVEAEDHAGTDNSEENLRAQLALPGHNPARDRIVAFDPADPQTLVGYNLVWLQPGSQAAQVNVIVHPAWRRQGIGSALLEQALAHLRQMEAVQAMIYANQAHPAAGSFLQAHGFLPAGAYTEMRAPADRRLPPVVWPYGYQVRPYTEVQDLAILTQVFNESYQDLPGHHQVTPEQMAEYLPQFIPEGLFLLFSEKNRPVGVSRVELSPERSAANSLPTGYIDSPGIYSPHRRLDLYRALLLTGMKWLQSQGVALIELESWGDKQEVLRSYFDLGFTILRQIITYQKQIE